ncbi:MAG: GTPase Era [Nitrospinaceae bacterium]
MTSETQLKSGYAAIIGKPNVGKSTLLNRLVPRKIAAMSCKPQTTRNKITGVVHLPGGQIILVDTPGIHSSTSRFNRLMVRASLSTFHDVDLILFLIDARQGFCPEDDFVLESLKKTPVTQILVINKIDLVAKPDLLVLIEQMRQKAAFVEIVPISALKRDGLDLLVPLILKYLPEGPQYFPEDMVTDCTEEFLLEEIVREKIMNLTRFEIPYSVAVIVENVMERENGVMAIDATICVEKASQKKIIIGEKGGMLKKMGTAARKEIEKRFGVRVYLNLFVKVKPKWRENDGFLKELGYLHDSYKNR